MVLGCRFWPVRWAFAVGVLLALCNCTTRVAPWPSLPREFLTTELASELTKLRVAQRAPKFGRLLYKANLRIGKDVSHLRYAIVFSIPGQLRIEALPLNGFYTLALFALNAERALAIDPQAKEVLVGADAGVILGRIFHVALNADDIVGLLSGLVPESAIPGARLYSDEAQQILELRSATAQRRYRIDGQSKRVTAVEVFSSTDGELQLLATCDSFAKQGDIEIPGKLVLELANEDVTIELELASANFSSPPSESLFRPVVPADYRIVSWGSAES